MHFYSHRLLVVILSLTLFSLSAKVEAQHSSEVALDLRTMTVEYTPALPADDPAHRMLLSTSGSPDGHVRVGKLYTDASICIGGVEGVVSEDEMPVNEAEDKDKADMMDHAAAPCIEGVELDLGEEELVTSNSADLVELVEAQYDLWLAGANGGWTLQVAEVQEGAATGPSEILGTVQLAHTTTAISSPTLVAGLVPNTNDEAQLVLRWDRHEWTTHLQFTKNRETIARRRAPEGDQRTFEFDTSEIQRSNRLAQRNMASVWLDDGPRLSVVYGKNLNVENRDFAHLVSVAPDMVVTTTGAAVIRLDIDVPLQFGDVTLELGNVGGLSDSPGGYGVWLKRAADAKGWRLVFNHEPDAWGTQYNSEFNVGEVDADYSQSNLTGDGMHDSTRALSASVMMTAPDQGRLLLVWGPHEWSADFSVAR